MRTGTASEVLKRSKQRYLKPQWSDAEISIRSLLAPCRSVMHEPHPGRHHRQLQHCSLRARGVG